MKDWYDYGEGSEHMKQAIAKATLENPIRPLKLGGVVAAVQQAEAEAAKYKKQNRKLRKIIKDLKQQQTKYTDAYKKHLNNECSTHCPYCEDDDEIGWLI